MLQSIVNFFTSIFQFLVNEIQGLINIVATLFNSITLFNTVNAYLPSIVAAFISLSVAALVIKFVIGR